MARDQKKQVTKVVKKAPAKVAHTDVDDIKKKPIVESEEDEAHIAKDRPVNIGDDFEEPVEGGDDFGGAHEEDDEEEDDAVYGASEDEGHHYV